MDRSEIRAIAKATADKVLENVHRYALDYKTPTSVPDSLTESISEENTAVDWYTRRAQYALNHNDQKTAALFVHVIRDEKEHAMEFSMRRSELNAPAMLTKEDRIKQIKDKLARLVELRTDRQKYIEQNLRSPSQFIQQMVRVKERAVDRWNNEIISLSLELDKLEGKIKNKVKSIKEEAEAADYKKIIEQARQILDEGNKKKSISQLETLLGQLPDDLVSNKIDVQSAIEDYEGVERAGSTPEEYADEKQAAFESIQEALDELELDEDEDEEEDVDPGFGIEGYSIAEKLGNGVAYSRTNWKGESVESYSFIDKVSGASFLAKTLDEAKYKLADLRAKSKKLAPVFFEVDEGQSIAAKLGNGVEYNGPQYKDGKIVYYTFTDKAVTGTTFGVTSVEQAKQRLIEIRQQYKRDPPVFNLIGSKAPKLPGFSTTTDIPMYESMVKLPDYYAKEKGLIYHYETMSPDEYLDRSDKLLGVTRVESSLLIGPGRVDRYAKMMKSGIEFDIPYLDYKHGDQEGRHRALAAKKAGYDLIPVMIVNKA